MQRQRRSATLSVAAAALVAVLESGCALPSIEGRDPSQMMTQTQDTVLGRAIAPRSHAQPGLTGLYLLQESHNAFAARMLLAGMAERSLDVQYYIWHQDLTGTMLFEALHQAAERGVRVRLLLDDNNTVGLDETLAALALHPKIEVRLFNPVAFRSLRFLGYLTDFSRMNRRMHNKSFTADNQATIIGGRNVGDGYFGAIDATLFEDLDVLAVGSVVEAVSHDFDRYWASASSYPVERIVAPVTSERLTERASQAAAAFACAPRKEHYMNALKESSFMGSIMAGDLPLIWAPTRMISDDPAKGLGQASPDELLLAKLKRALGSPKRRLDLVSPYFVPTAAGVEALSTLSKDGVAVRVLTNSLEATDVSAVHAGYAKRRKALLKAGIWLYELRRDANAPLGKSTFGSSSASSLHAKTFAVDNERAFIGSLNFDPRSAKLNTELGFLIESPQIAAAIHGAFDKDLPARAYEVQLDDRSHLIWIERRDGIEVRHDTEPGTGLLQRLWIRLLSVLPIEWLL